MQDQQKNTPDIDPSGLFNTYKTGSDTSGDVAQNNFFPPVRKEEPNAIKAVQIIVNGCVRIVKTGVWGIAVLGGLFVTALATNTIDRAISIINANIGTNITAASGEITVAENKQQPAPKVTPGLTSNTLNTASSDNTVDDTVSKRKAILEARKAARLLEEQQKAVEKTLQ